MLVNRTVFFAALFIIPIGLMVAGKIYWLLHSQKARAVYFMKGRGNALEQMRASYSILYFKHGKDTVWFNGPGNIRFKEGDVVPVRYNTANPSDAKVDTFLAFWGATVIYGGLPLLVLLVITLHPHIVPYRSRLRLSGKKPFIQIV